MSCISIALLPLLLSHPTKAQSEKALGSTLEFSYNLRDIESGDLGKDCLLIPRRRHLAVEQFVVTGARACDGKNFLEVLVNGEATFVPQGALEIKPEAVRQLAELPGETKEKWRDLGIAISKDIYSKQLTAAIKALDATAAKGVTLLDWETYRSSEYAEGTSVKFKIYNPTKKTIKYVTLTLVGLNPVKDPVKNLRGQTNVSMRGVGPIEAGKFGAWEFDHVWHTNLVEYSRPVSMKIEYMDGTTRQISDVHSVTLAPRHWNTLSSRAGN